MQQVRPPSNSVSFGAVGSAVSGGALVVAAAAGLTPGVTSEGIRINPRVTAIASLAPKSLAIAS